MPEHLLDVLGKYHIMIIVLELIFTIIGVSEKSYYEDNKVTLEKNVIGGRE